MIRRYLIHRGPMATSAAVAVLVAVAMIASGSALASPAEPSLPSRSAERVNGRVTDDRGRPIEAATLVGGEGEIAVSGSDGRFVIELKGERVFVVSAPGYATRTVVGGKAPLRIALTAAVGEIIEIVGRTVEATRPTEYTLTGEQIRGLPGAGNDALRALQSLPGVARIPFSFGGLVLRGASPRDTNVYLDGVEVPLAFHFGGVTSFYPSNLLDSVTVLNGGFDASYGRAQGGLVTLTTREPRTDEWRSGGEIALLHSSAYAEGPLAGGGVIVGVRRSYFDTVAGPLVGEDVPLPSYWDAQIRGTWGSPSGEGRIAPTLVLSFDRVANDEISFDSGFVRLSAPYVRQWGRRTLTVVPWLGGNWLRLEEHEDDHGDDDGGDRDESFSRPTYPAGLRAELAADQPWGHLRGGIDLQASYVGGLRFSFDDGPEQNGLDEAARWFDAAMWGEIRYQLAGDRLSLRPGLRIERYGLSDEIVVDPRLAIALRLSDAVTLRQGVARFHQPPLPAELDPRLGNPSLDSSHTDQLSLGVDFRLAGALSGSVTGYFHDGQDIGVVVADESGDDVPSPDAGGLGATFQELLEKQLGFSTHRANVGRARSYGIELGLRRQVGRLFTMLSYTLSRAQRTDDPTRFIGWRPYELDQRHNLHAIAAVELGRWRLGARASLTSGNAYLPGADDGSGGTGAERTWLTLPTFFALDLRVDRRYHPGWGTVDLYLDVQNATNHRNVEARQLDDDGDLIEETRGLPIIPILGVEFIPR